MFPIPVEWPSPAMEMGAAFLYLALALIVTIDVLLKKSDVRSALGWIGAVWLAPVFGSFLYYLFGINRVRRRALRLQRANGALARAVEPATLDAAPHIRLLSQVSQTITQCPLTGGNNLTILEGGDQAYPEMLAAIHNARYCVAMSSYIF